jgi:hypothetical protein
VIRDCLLSFALTAFVIALPSRNPHVKVTQDRFSYLRPALPSDSTVSIKVAPKFFP